ncbi:MAG TPA: sugar phosphate isomerase/epimerase family protein [Planctomycetota bacterium]|nr:sugar phosphate isomerase/epimerase family protein [Planctomycetota bacterium]HRR82096.1 sugar phosphate isomerase/epimerase family protein [Planctomycetota bacterium]HRT97895.1 sugar phosphate isomerase/epimerase family protein [Planctomycetota bacterium]
MELTRISACTYPLRAKPAAEALAAMGQAGFKKVDLWGNVPHFSADPARCDPSALEAAARAAGVGIANLGTYCGGDFASDSEEVRARSLAEMKATIDLAARFGARSIRVRPGTSEDPAIIPRLVPLFAESAAYAATRGIYLGMENHGGSLAGNVEAAVRLCEAVGSPHFGILYEPCNLSHARVDYRAAFEAFKPWIVHIHVKDGRWAADKFQATHLGEGEIDYPWVVGRMEAMGYRGDYALEYEICDVEPLETALPRWLSYFARL